MNTIGQNIASIRKKKGMTQEELAEKMGVTSQAVSKWECDISYPDIATVSVLARVLSVSSSEIIDGVQKVPVIADDMPEVINRRVVLIQLYDNESSITIRFPVPAVKKAIENGTFAKIIGEQSFEGIEGALSMIDLGLVGPLVTLETEDSNIKISVEDYED